MPPKGYEKIFGKFKSDFKPTSQNLIKILKSSSKLSDSDIDFLKAMYDCEIRYTDDVLRNFFKELRHINFLKDYIVIITADHGEEFREHKGFSHWPKFYDELIHIPLIIKLPDIKKGKIVEDLIQHIDISPTILGHLKIKKPQNYQGIDILRRFDTTTSNVIHTRGVISETLVKNGRVSKNGKGKVIISYRTRKWKLIIDFEKKSKELYDLAEDPDEKINLYDEKIHIAKTFEDILFETAQVNMKIKRFMED